MTGFTRESGNVHSSGIPGSTTCAKPLYCIEYTDYDNFTIAILIDEIDY